MKRLLMALWLYLLLQSAALAASCSSYPFTLQNNTTADATQVMSNFNTVRNCVINNAAGSGVNTDITSLTGLTTPLSVPQGGTPVFIGGTSTGTANAQVVASTSPIGYSLTNGYRVTFTAGATNTGAATLNVNSTGATAIRRVGHAGLEALTGGEMVSGNIVEAIYNGTFFVLLNSDLTGIGTRTNIATGATVDLGTVPTHNASITNSGGTITSFGSTAVVTDPIYLISFAGANTLTHNATSLIIPGGGNITTAANDTAVVEYLGSGNWQVLSYTRASGGGIVVTSPLCGATGYTLTNNAGTPNTNADQAAGTVVMVNSSGVSITGLSVSVTINATTVGANGLDTGALANSTWYYAYFINNGTTTAGLLSTSASAPTMPSGYTYKCLLGALRTDGSAAFLRILQQGNIGQYKVTAATNTAALPTINGSVTGSVTIPTYTSVAVQNVCVPNNATAIQMVLAGAASANASAIAAPSNAYGAVGSISNPPPFTQQTGATASYVTQYPAWMNLESANVFYASNTTDLSLKCMAWKLSVNAN